MPVDISSRIVYAEWTQRPTTNGIGTFQLILDNGDSALNGAFAADDPLSLSINSVEILTGYLDKRPIKLKDYSNFLYLSGRDSGQDLQNKLLWSLYAHTDAFSGKADDVIEDMLTQVASEIGFTSPGTAPEIYYSSNWNPLCDQIKEVLESINYIGNVNKDLAFDMWPISTGKDSGITLKSLLGDASNNVIGDVDYEPGDSTDVRNYLIVQGPRTNKDAYSEMNAADWDTIEAGDVISDFTAASPGGGPKAGAAAIKCTSDDAKHAGFELSFPKYWLWWLDFHLVASDDLKFSILMAHSGGLSAPDTAYVELEDTDGNIMQWGYANCGRQNKWRELSVKIGFNETDNAGWDHIVGTDFNWYVVRFKFYFYRDAIPGTLQYILLDDLQFPAAITAAYDGTLSTPVHTLRTYKIARTDITSQVELQQFADQLGPKLNAVIPTLNLTAVGNAGLISGVWKWLPGYYATAQIKDANNNYLPANNSKWRFMELTHKFDPKAPNKNHVYTVDLKMIPYDLVVDNQRWVYMNDPDNSPLRRIRDRLRYIENTQSGNAEPQA